MTYKKEPCGHAGAWTFALTIDTNRDFSPGSIMCFVVEAKENCPLGHTYISIGSFFLGVVLN